MNGIPVNPTLKGGEIDSGIIYPGAKMILTHHRNFYLDDVLPGFVYNLLLCRVKMVKWIQHDNHLANRIFQK